MANRVTVTIRSHFYHILAEEEEGYIRQCADLVARELDRAMDGTTLSIDDGAVLAALNLADQFYKEKQVSDNLRAQLKQALDENTRIRRQGSGKKPGRPPKAPKAAEAPKAPKAPEVPKADGAPKAPEAPKADAVPKAPEAPKADAAPKAPKAPETPVANRLPAANEAPKVPKAPRPAEDAYQTRLPIPEEPGR